VDFGELFTEANEQKFSLSVRRFAVIEEEIRSKAL